MAPLDPPPPSAAVKILPLLIATLAWPAFAQDWIGVRGVTGTYAASGTPADTWVLLRERADGKVLGTIHGAPGLWIHSGQRTGASVVLGLRAVDGDPSTPWEGTLDLDLDGADLSGDLIDGTTVLPVTLTRTTIPWVEEVWQLFDETLEGSLEVRRLEDRTGSFVAGGFRGVESCDFMACGGAIDSWTIGGTAHVITTSSGGGCPQVGVLSGTFDSAINILSGSWTSTNCSGAVSGGSFLGGKAGLVSSLHIPALLDSLADFADAFEAESPDAAEVFHSAYLSDGMTRAGWEAQLAAWYAAYDSIEVEIEGPYEIITYDDGEVNAFLGGDPRVDWTVRASGIDVATGLTETFYEREEPALLGPDLRYIGTEAGRTVFVGNGATRPFDIGLPILLSDVSYIVFGAWPFGVHGGGHPEDGHGGIDFEYIPGSLAYAAEAGEITAIYPNDHDPSITQWDVYQQVRSGIQVQYGHILDPPLVSVGDVVAQGEAIGSPTQQTGDIHASIHFAVHMEGAPDLCPVDWFDAAAAADWDTIWPACHYTEELCEPFACNDRTADPPFEATWDLETAGTSPGPETITFLRSDGYAFDHVYTFYDAAGAVLESGVTEWTSSPGTLGLKFIADGGGAVTFGACDVIDDVLWISLDASMPSTMVGAAVYRYRF
ncbi:MAG: hypothetical protein CMJ84_18795 [Planctomycetes bacterium]|nr:hypothetical protein [Planctomycetota bacterium]